MSYLNNLKIEGVNFPENLYYKEKFNKRQIYLHHTASGKGVGGDIAHWCSNPSRIATCIILDHDGVIHQAFSSKYWGHHLGIKSSFFRKRGLPSINHSLNAHSVAIEIDSWGPLGFDKDRGVFESYCGKEVEPEDVQYYENGFLGYQYYERYTDRQIASLRLLLLHLGEKYGIDLEYKEDMWGISDNALTGKSGIYTHISVRPDKTDCHPQPELIEMLKSLKNR